MRIDDFYSENDLNEDLASFARGLGIDPKAVKQKATTAMIGGALATAGVHMATKQEPVPDYNWGNPLSAQELSKIEQTADDSGLKVSYEYEQPEAKPTRGVDNKASVVPQTRAMSQKKKEVFLMALTMWGEARSHGIEGMRAVGHVIMNRVHANRPDKFGTGIVGVVWKRKQFSCWNPGDPNRDAMREISQLPKDSLEYKRWSQAKELAASIIRGRSQDPTDGALWYHTTGVNPIWAKAMNPIKKIASHLFYRKTA